MAKKETKDMLVRAVNFDVWERIDRHCRQRGLKRRDFLVRAIDHFEGEDGGQAVQEQRTRARGDEIQATIKAYEMIINLKKKIIKIRNDIGIMNDETVEMNMFLDLKRLNEDLDKMIKEYVPKYDIPDDPEARKEMGLPHEYSHSGWYMTYEESLKRKRNMCGPVPDNQNNDGADSDEYPPVGGFDMTPEELEAELKKLMAKQNEADTRMDEMAEDYHPEDPIQNTDDKNDEPPTQHNEDVDVYELNRSRRKGIGGKKG